MLINKKSLDLLQDLIERMYNSKSGCPWIKEQSFKSISSFTIEEAYEIADAIEKNNYDELKSEIADIILHIIMYLQIAKQKGLFTIDNVISQLYFKIKKIAPHLFDSQEPIKSLTSAEALTKWNNIKIQERKIKNENSVMDNIPRSMSPLKKSHILQKRASLINLDWTVPTDILKKVEEELDELKIALKEHKQDKIQEELGDLLFTVINLVRGLKLDSNIVLGKANNKFEQRVRKVEKIALQENINLDTANESVIDNLWRKAKEESS